MKLASLLLILVLLTHCISINRKITYLPLGKTKMDVLSVLGKPNHIYRKNNTDRWMYRFYVDGKTYSRTIFFKRGKVIKKDRVRRYPSPNVRLNDAENFKDYQEAVKEIRNN